MNKYAVTPFHEATQYVEAEKMELTDKSVTLFVGDQVKAHFPHIESVVVDIVPAPASVELVAGELAQFDLSPRVEIGAITINGGADPRQVAALVREFLVDLRNSGPIR